MNVLDLLRSEPEDSDFYTRKRKGMQKVFFFFLFKKIQCCLKLTLTPHCKLPNGVLFLYLVFLFAIPFFVFCFVRLDIDTS